MLGDTVQHAARILAHCAARPPSPSHSQRTFRLRALHSAMCVRPRVCDPLVVGRRHDRWDAEVAAAAVGRELHDDWIEFANGGMLNHVALDLEDVACDSRAAITFDMRTNATFRARSRTNRAQPHVPLDDVGFLTETFMLPPTGMDNKRV